LLRSAADWHHTCIFEEHAATALVRKDAIMILVNILLGSLLLLFGRRLFWAFVAVAGFLVGVEVATVVLEAQPVWVQILAGVGVGLLGAIVAVIAQRLGFALLGFYAVGYLSMIAGESLAPQWNPLVWFVVGGIAGAIVAAIIMDRALIVLSSLVGAAAVVSDLTLSPLLVLLVFVGLVVLGVVFQSRSLPAAGRERV
jgi:hypothetical protein